MSGPTPVAIEVTTGALIQCDGAALAAKTAEARRYRDM